ncbi:hypothetical protein BGZ98_006808, partial [Dissophora globulifera]
MPTPLPGGVASRIAVSGDSDLLVYSTIPSVLRPMPGGKGYAMYHKRHVLNAVEFTNSMQLELLGVVSHSDYAKNVRGFGVARNAKIIRNLIWLPASTVPNMLRQYVLAVLGKVTPAHTIP